MRPQEFRSGPGGGEGKIHTPTVPLTILLLVAIYVYIVFYEEISVKSREADSTPPSYPYPILSGDVSDCNCLRLGVDVHDR